MDPDLENTVVYRAEIVQWAPVSVIDASDIVKVVENWISTANQFIQNINPNCPITLKSLDAEDCVILATTTCSIHPARGPATTTSSS